MAFISLLFAGTVLVIVMIILIIGLILLLGGLTFDTIWIVKKAKKKKTGKVIKIFAIALSILGVMMFVVPIGCSAILVGTGKVISDVNYNSQPNKIYAADFLDWRQTFEVEGKTFVRIADYFYMEPNTNYEIERYATLVLGNDEKNNGYAKISKIETTCPEQLFVIENYKYYYCYEADYDKIMDYYRNAAKVTYKLCMYGDKDYTKCIEMDRDKYLELEEFYHENDMKDFCCSTKDEIRYFTIYMDSEDKVYHRHVSFGITKDDDVYFSYSMSGGTISGYLLSEDAKEYVIQLIEAAE